MNKIFRTTGMLSLVIWAVFFFVGLAQKRVVMCVISAAFFLLAFLRRQRAIRDQNSAQKLWKAFAAGNDELLAYPYQLWRFPKGETIQKVLNGQICGESFLLPMFELNRQRLPEAGQYNVVCDSANRAVCVVRTTGIFRSCYGDVAGNLASIEGYASSKEWQTAKGPKFERICKDLKIPFSDDLQILFEKFEIVFRAS